MKKNINKKYKNYKECNLPTPYMDNETGAFEYVYYNPLFTDEINKYHHLTTALEDITFASVYYPYALTDYKYLENGERVPLETLRGGHAHNFEELIGDLYAYPESFILTEEDEEFYSKQELQYIRRTQNYLKLIGVKDIDMYKDKWEKYINENQKKYQGAFPIKFTDIDIEQVLSGKRLFTVHEYNPNYSKGKIYEPNENKALVINKNEDFICFIEFTSAEIKKYKDIKHLYECDNYLDEDKVEIQNFKVIEKFKDN